jgi:hypothetical protein
MKLSFLYQFKALNGGFHPICHSWLLVKIQIMLPEVLSPAHFHSFEVHTAAQGN